MPAKKVRLAQRRLKNNTQRRLALKRAHRKINMRRQSFQNREIYSFDASPPPGADAN